MYFILILLVLVLWYLHYRIKNKRRFELAALIPSAPGLHSFFGTFEYTYNATNLIFPLLKKYSEYAFENGGMIKFWAGPLIYIGLTDPTDVQFVLKNYMEKEKLTQVIRDLIGNAAIFGPVHIWSRRRKILVPAFSPKIIRCFVDILVKQSQDLVDQLVRDNRVGTGQFTIWPYVNAYTLSSVAETSLGVKLDAQRNPDIPFLKAINQALFLMTKRIFNVWLWPHFIFRLSSVYREQEKCKEIFYGLTDKIIQERREALKDFNINKYDNSVFGQGNDQVMSFLDHLILISGSEGNKVSDVELREEILVFLVAGTDTSAVAISNTLKLLGMYPKVQEKVYEELTQVLKKDNVTFSDLQELKYLHRVIKESLRLYPPVPIVARRIQDEITLPSGVTLPEDCSVVVPIWAIHRNPKYWGQSADCFDPDRFISEREEASLMPFSAGPRNCVGYQYAMMVVKIALATILRQYRIVGEENSSPVPDIDCTFSIMLRAKDGYQISLERR